VILGKSVIKIIHFLIINFQKFKVLEGIFFFLTIGKIRLHICHCSIYSTIHFRVGYRLLKLSIATF
jgi:hypothetical protein